MIDTPEHAEFTKAPLTTAHFIELFFRHRVFLIIAIPIFACLFAGASLFIQPKDPDLEARALIGIGNATGMTAVQDATEMGLGREDLMTSRTFLRDIARSLSLQLVTEPKSRSELFDSVNVDSTARGGIYRMAFDKRSGKLAIQYYEGTTLWLPLIGPLPFNSGKVVFTLDPNVSTRISLPGIQCVLSKAFLDGGHPAVFKVTGIRFAVEMLLRSLVIKRADPQRGINQIAIIITGKDYEMMALSANAIAQAFVEKNLNFRRIRSHGIVASYEKQLAIAAQDVAVANEMLRAFRSSNPRLGLTMQAQQTVQNLSQIENSIQTTQSILTQAHQLQADYPKASPDEQIRIASQMIQIMGSANYSAAPILQSQLNPLLDEKRTLSQSYAENHPLVIENVSKIASASNNVVSAFGEFINTSQLSVSHRAQSMSELNGELQRLPSKELQLNALQRNQQVATEIYTSVLSRSNEAKVADGVNVADYYLMDSAVAPMAPPDSRGKTVIIAFLLGLLFPGVLIVARDFFEKTVHTRADLQRYVKAPVLEAIPSFKQISSGQIKNLRPLILTECKPPYVVDLFDALFLKVKMRFEEGNSQVITFTGLDASCGKSTIAANLAICIARHGHKVLLIDADIYRGSLHSLFDFPRYPGLTDALIGSTSLAPTLSIKLVDAELHDEKPEDTSLGVLEKSTNYIKQTSLANLYAMSCGKEIENPVGAFSSERMTDMLTRLRSTYPFIILDAPPIGIVPDAASFHPISDGYVVVVKAGLTNIETLRSKLAEFPPIAKKIFGYVLNYATDTKSRLYSQSYNRYRRT